MSARDSGARSGGSPLESGLRQLARGLDALARRVRGLEQRSQAPAGLRFDTESDENGTYLVVERVATGNRERISGPL